MKEGREGFPAAEINNAFVGCACRAKDDDRRSEGRCPAAGVNQKVGGQARWRSIGRPPKRRREELVKLGKTDSKTGALVMIAGRESAISTERS